MHLIAAEVCSPGLHGGSGRLAPAAAGGDLHGLQGRAKDSNSRIRKAEEQGVVETMIITTIAMQLRCSAREAKQARSCNGICAEAKLASRSGRLSSRAMNLPP